MPSDEEVARAKRLLDEARLCSDPDKAEALRREARQVAVALTRKTASTARSTG